MLDLIEAFSYVGIGICLSKVYHYFLTTKPFTFDVPSGLSRYDRTTQLDEIKSKLKPHQELDEDDEQDGEQDDEQDGEQDDEQDDEQEDEQEYEQEDEQEDEKDDEKDDEQEDEQEDKIGEDEEKKVFSDQEINRMSHLLKEIEKSRLELAEIQNFYSTYSIYRICEPAANIVEKTLGEQIMWTN